MVFGMRTTKELLIDKKDLLDDREFNIYKRAITDVEQMFCDNIQEMFRRFKLIKDCEGCLKHAMEETGTELEKSDLNCKLCSVGILEEMMGIENK